MTQPSPADPTDGLTGSLSPSERAGEGATTGGLRYRLVTATIKGLIGVLCRVEATELARVPARGPLLMVSNHINFLDVPLLYTHLQPRPITGFAKAETWHTPLGRWLADLWGGIPLHRGEADAGAFHRALDALNTDHILAVAPEGTRSGDGRLRRGRPGIAWLAERAGVPLLPVAHYGGERFWPNLRRIRRTAVTVRVGAPFRLEISAEHTTRAMRQEIADAIMRRLAALLPPAYRGAYDFGGGAEVADPAPDSGTGWRLAPM